MAKEKKQKQINLEEITALTKELFHAHYAGDLERWFDYLCPDSIYLGTGEPMLFGGSAIREHFKGFEGRAVDVVSEEYYPVPLGETAAQVCGQIAVRSRQNQLGAVNCFTIGWRLIGGELKERLPEVFYPLRRGYLVNTLYIVALRRFEAELISGISIPIPALTYTQVKRDLQELIEKK